VFLSSTLSQTLLTLRIVLFRLFTLQIFMALATVRSQLLLVRWVTSSVTTCLINTTRKLVVRISGSLQSRKLMLSRVSTSSELGILHGADRSTMTGLGRSAAHIHMSSTRTHSLHTHFSMTKVLRAV